MGKRPILAAALVPAVGYYVAMFALGPLFGIATWEWSVGHWLLAAAGLAAALLVAGVTRAWPPERVNALTGALEVGLRYALAYLLINFGIAKIYPGQFISYNRDMDLSLGTVSAFRLAWRFFGYSDLYVGFTAAAELLAAVLLCWRRSAALGALVATGVMANIVTLDLAFSIPPLPIASTMAVTATILLLASSDKLRALLAPVAGHTHAGAPTPWWRSFVTPAILLAMVGLQIRDGALTSTGLSRQSPPTGRWDVLECAPNAGVRLCQSEVDTTRGVLYLEIGRWGEFVLASERHPLSFSYDPQTESLTVRSLPRGAGGPLTLALRGRVTDGDSVVTLQASGDSTAPFAVRLRRTRRLRYPWF